MPRLLSVNAHHTGGDAVGQAHLAHLDVFKAHGWQTTAFAMAHHANHVTPDAAFFARAEGEGTLGAGAWARRAARAVYNRDARRALARLLNVKRFDVAHLHALHDHLTPSILPLLSRHGVPVVMTLHDLKLVCPAGSMFNATGQCAACRPGRYAPLVRNRCIGGSLSQSVLVAARTHMHRALRTFDHVDCFVAPSRDLRDRLIGLGWPADRIVHIPPMAPDLPDGIARGYDGPILYVGALEARQGLATLIKASAQSGVPVDIAGAGTAETDLRRLSGQLDAPVAFLGQPAEAALLARMARARAVVVPSVWPEIAPVQILMAYHLRRPVLGADVGGIGALVETEDGPAGWLFVPGNVTALAAALERAAATPPMHVRALGDVGHRLLRRAHSRDAYFEAVSGLYAAVRAGRPRADGARVRSRDADVLKYE